MVEEVPVEEASASVEAIAVGELQSPDEAIPNVNAEKGTESARDNNDNSTGAVTTEEDGQETADELLEKGSQAARDGDFNEAADCLSRALEISVAQYGELAPECVKFYYKYGRALLYKAQEEADPLVAVPKKGGESEQDLNKSESFKNAQASESSAASASSNNQQVPDTNNVEGADDGSTERDQADDEDSDGEDLAEAEEDESDLDLAWKMLDIARAIVEKQSDDTMEKVDILSALAEVSLEREDIQTSLSDYQKALSILEKLVEADSRQIAELNFRICLCLEVGSQPQEAISYCAKAISVCKCRVERIMHELNTVTSSTTPSSASESNQPLQQSENESATDMSVTDKQAEIDTLNGLLGELEKKLEDLQQLALNPKSILSEILGIESAKAQAREKSPSPPAMSSSQMGTAKSNAGLDSPTVSTAHSNGSAPAVTHLGVVGRGVKRVVMSSITSESSATKKPALENDDANMT